MKNACVLGFLGVCKSEMHCKWPQILLHRAAHQSLQHRRGKSNNRKRDINRKRLERESERTGKILIPRSFSYYEEHYEAVEANLRALGFVNIKLVNLQDLVFDVKKKNGHVESLNIAGKSMDKRTLYNPDDTVVIEYHGYKTDKKQFGGRVTHHSQ